MTLRPMAPTVPAAPVTRIGESCSERVVITFSLGNQVVMKEGGCDRRCAQATAIEKSRFARHAAWIMAAQEERDGASLGLPDSLD
ncbi:hypothetical protein GCM10027081_31570 [Cupriavidus yeoncheonensis]